MTIEFKDVGHNKRKWKADLDGSESSIIREILKSGALLSREIDVADGYIYAGFRCVGTYGIVQETSLSA